MYNYIFDTHENLKIEEKRLIEEILLQDTEYGQYELTIKLRLIRVILEACYNFMVINNGIPDVDDVSEISNINDLDDIEDFDIQKIMQ
jgi:hypothetical protein